MKLTDVLEVMGIGCGVAFVFFIWPPLSLAVLSVALIAVSFLRTRGGR